jgi:trehalose-6-phosphatase
MAFWERDVNEVVQKFIENLNGSRHEVDGNTIRVFFGSLEDAKQSFVAMESVDIGFSTEGCLILNYPHESNGFEDANIQFTLK